MNAARRPRTLSRRLSLLALLLVLAWLPGQELRAQIATPVASGQADSAIPLAPAWLQFGPNGALLARIIVSGDCPSLAIDGADVPMQPRTTTTTEFPVTACEATIPFGVTSAIIEGRSLALPTPPYTRIAVLGDTGCRLSDWEQAYQDCNDPVAWPFAEVAASIAAWQPDLIVHVGDFLYRENPCPAGRPGCAGSPYGDDWAAWNADFFAPASPLLGGAPWVIMRGNHETCSRNPEGWFRFLDPRPYLPECQRFTDPYLIPLVDLTLAVIDSAEASDTTDSPEEVAEYSSQFAALAEMSPEGAWLVTHRPMWGILAGDAGEVEVDNASYNAATGGNLGAEYGMILSGHIHLAQSLSFSPASGRPAQVIAGNSGTLLDAVPSGSPTARQLDDPDIEDAENLEAFGFMTLERDGDAWLATQRGADGKPLVTCELALPEVVCASATD